MRMPWLQHRYCANVVESWNKAIELCGLTPNVQWMCKKKLVCDDGHVADSVSELIVDNWLTSVGLKHKRSKKYPGTRMTCDFYVQSCDAWIEYFGLAGEHKEYDIQILRKKEYAKKLGINLFCLVPTDLYPCNNIDGSLKSQGFAM